MKPITKLLIIAGVMLTVWTVGYMLLAKGLRQYNFLKETRMKEILQNRTPFDIIYVGSSRTHNTIDPGVVDSLLGVKSFNLGIQGGNMVEFNMIIKAYLQNHPAPELIVLTLDAHSFTPDRPIFNYTQYLDYTSNKVIDTTLSRYGHKTWLFKALPIMRISAFTDLTRRQAIDGLRGKNDLRGRYHNQGFLALGNGVIDPDSLTLPIQTVSFDKERIALLQEIILLCKTKRINLIFTYAPEWQGVKQGVTNFEEFLKLANSIAHKNQIPFWRHDLLPMCQNHKQFTNVRHVNTTGAKAYSALLAPLVAPYLAQ
jgi:hypothetical protein